MNEISDFDLKILIKLRQEGASLDKICQEIKIDKRKCGNLVKLHVPDCKYKTKQEIYNENQEIGLLYKDGYCISDISNILEIPKAGVYRNLLANGINTTFSNNEFYDRYKDRLITYPIDDSIFENINSPEKAYILGFIFADGNAHLQQNHIKLKLAEEDKHILEEMLLYLKYNRPLYFNKKIKNEHQNQYCLCICNCKIYQDLIRHGVKPQKTFLLEWPEIDVKFYSHFVRGYFDGDGCLSIDKHSNMAEIKMISSTKFCQQMLDILENYDVHSYIDHDKRVKYGVDNLRIRRQGSVRTFLDWIYEESTMHLKRKHDIFVKWLAIRQAKQDRRKK